MGQMGSLCSRQGAEKEHSRHEKRNKSRKKKVSPANQKQISSLTSDIDLELKDLDKDFAQLEEANKKHKNNEHQNKRNQDRRRSTLATIENFDMGGGGFEITLENPSLEHLEDEEKKKKKKEDRHQKHKRRRSSSHRKSKSSDHERNHSVGAGLTKEELEKLAQVRMSLGGDQQLEAQLIEQLSKQSLISQISRNSHLSNISIGNQSSSHSRGSSFTAMASDGRRRKSRSTKNASFLGRM